VGGGNKDEQPLRRTFPSEGTTRGCVKSIVPLAGIWRSCNRGELVSFTNSCSHEYESKRRGKLEGIIH
jgi:hypothetical protein